MEAVDGEGLLATGDARKYWDAVAYDVRRRRRQVRRLHEGVQELRTPACRALPL